MGDADRVLVAYGTKHGATAAVADVIGARLPDGRRPVDARRARRVRSVGPFRAVVPGSGVCAARWRSDAVGLLRRPRLNERAVWRFGNGPVGEDEADPARLERWTRPERVPTLAACIGVREHVGFGGKVAEDARVIRRKMARRSRSSSVIAAIGTTSRRGRRRLRTQLAVSRWSAIPGRMGASTTVAVRPPRPWCHARRAGRCRPARPHAQPTAASS